MVSCLAVMYDRRMSARLQLPASVPPRRQGLSLSLSFSLQGQLYESLDLAHLSLPSTALKSVDQLTSTTVTQIADDRCFCSEQSARYLSDLIFMT